MTTTFPLQSTVLKLVVDKQRMNQRIRSYLCQGGMSPEAATQECLMITEQVWETARDQNESQLLRSALAIAINRLIGGGLAVEHDLKAAPPEVRCAMKPAPSYRVVKCLRWTARKK